MHASWPDHATIALARCPLGRDHGSFSNSHRPSSEGTFRVDAPDQFLFTRWIEAELAMALDQDARYPQRKRILVIRLGAVFAEGATTLTRRQVKTDGAFLQDCRIERLQDIRQRCLPGLKSLTGLVSA